MTTGLLALQGAFDLHRRMLTRLGEPVVEVRTVADLEKVDRLIIPGGESSVMAMLAERTGLAGAMKQRIARGMPTLGTCAGAILLASKVVDGRDDQISLGVVDMVIRRNAYGSQSDSFTTRLHIWAPAVRSPAVRSPAVASTVADADERTSAAEDESDGAILPAQDEPNQIESDGEPEEIEAIFIRAPVIEHVGDDVVVLAEYDGQPVMVSQGVVIATTFHPELSDDPTIHELFLRI